MTDQEIQLLESTFPSLSGRAFTTARERVLQSGQSILESKDGIIYQVYPDGRKVVVKKIEPPTRVAAGKIITIR
jgi:hypothetical protein